MSRFRVYELSKLLLDELTSGHLSWRTPLPQDSWAISIIEKYFQRVVPPDTSLLKTILRKVRGKPVPVWERSNDQESIIRAILNRASEHNLTVLSLSHEDEATRMILHLCDDAYTHGHEDGVEIGTESVGWTCVCTCIEHGRRACPKCQNVELCPVHTEVDPASLRPELLEDPYELEKALRATYLDLGSDEPWNEQVMTEALRRVVSARV